MSTEFIKTISEAYRQRYMFQIQSLVANKIPCGLLYGMSSSENAPAMLKMLTNSGINITCICDFNNYSKNKKIIGGGCYGLKSE